MTASEGRARCRQAPRCDDRASQAECPASEVRDTSRHPSDTNFGSKRGASKQVIPVPLFDLKFLGEFAAAGAGTSNRRHWPQCRYEVVSRRGNESFAEGC